MLTLVLTRFVSFDPDGNLWLLAAEERRPILHCEKLVDKEPMAVAL
jgi:hypothetical protein